MAGKLSTTWTEHNTIKNTNASNIQQEWLNPHRTVGQIGSGSRGQGPWPLLNFKTLRRNSIFVIENHLSLAKWPP